MHQCLLICEITEQIAEYLYDKNDVWSSFSAKTPNSLISLMLTCRALCDPALNVLWRELQSPYPLAFAFQPGVTPVKALPESGGEESENEEDEENEGCVSCESLI